MTTSDQRDRDRRRRTAAPSTGTSGVGQLSMQVGGVSVDTGVDLW